MSIVIYLLFMSIQFFDRTKQNAALDAVRPKQETSGQIEMGDLRRKRPATNTSYEDVSDTLTGPGQTSGIPTPTIPECVYEDADVIGALSDPCRSGSMPTPSKQPTSPAGVYDDPDAYFSNFQKRQPKPGCTYEDPNDVKIKTSKMPKTHTASTKLATRVRECHESNDGDRDDGSSRARQPKESADHVSDVYEIPDASQITVAAIKDPQSTYTKLDLTSDCEEDVEGYLIMKAQVYENAPQK